MEEKKNLAEEYLAKVGEDAIYFRDYPNMPLYREDKIKMAFYAGQESVFNSIPKLLFKERELVAEAPLLNECYYIRKSVLAEEPRYTFAFKYQKPTQWYDTLEETMDAANADYKKRIRNMLGL